MKTKIVTPGLVIRETPVGENDKLLAILTAENGLIRAFADGARRIKSKNAAATSLLSYCTFTLYKAKDTYKVTDAVVIDLFFELRYDLEGLALAQYFCELALRQVPEGQHNAVFLRLLLNALFLVMHHKRPFELIKAGQRRFWGLFKQYGALRHAAHFVRPVSKNFFVYRAAGRFKFALRLLRKVPFNPNRKPL